MYSAKALAKKRRKRIYTILLCIVVCVVNFTPIIVRRIYKIENVFDEMFYSGYGDIGYFGFFPWGVGITGCTYDTVRVFDQGRRSWSNNIDETSIEDFGMYYKSYDEKKLKKGEGIGITIDLNQKGIYYRFAVSGKDKGTMVKPLLSWELYYFTEEKTMYINGPTLYFSKGEERLSTTDEEQIISFLQENGYDKTAEEYEHYFLYDKIIHDWTLGNLFRSRYATWWIGSVKFVDGPPPEEVA